MAGRLAVQTGQTTGRAKPAPRADGPGRAKDRGVTWARARQSKWGRHCCRPHSHRCVVLSPMETGTWHPMPSLPAIRKWSSGTLTGARTGIRLHPPIHPVECARSENPRFFPRPTFNRQLRNLTFRNGRLPRAVASRIDPQAAVQCLLGCQPGWPGSQRNDFAAQSSTRLVSDRSLRREGLLCRADRFRHVFPVQNFPVLSGFWAIQSSSFPRRSDDLKLRLAERFCNGTRPEFSTFPGFPCGGGWITQPLVAKM